MCKDRGYLVTDEEINISLEEFKDQHGGYLIKDFKSLLVTF